MAKRRQSSDWRPLLVVASLFVAAETNWWLGGALLVAGLVWYVLKHPVVYCARCKGDPRTHDASGKHFNVRCWWCGSTGKRKRWLPRLIGWGWGDL